MRSFPAVLTLLAVLALPACGKSSDMRSASGGKLNTFDVAEPAPDAAATAAERQGPAIAYSYDIAYALDGGSIAAIEAQHAALCHTLGSGRCQLASSTVSDGSDNQGDANGEARLIVDARIATAFSQRLDAAVAQAGGRVTSRGTTAEDVSKQVIDVKARLAAKQALAERLAALIRSANGNVGELVAAEKAYADAQGELEAARGEQAALAQRVAMSDFTLHYASRGSGSILAPVARSLHGAGATLGWSIAGLVTFVVVAAPWLVLLTLVTWALRRLGWRPRWPWRRRGAVLPRSD